MVYLLGVVCIVGQQDVLVVLYLEVESAVNAFVCLHAVAQFLGVASVELCHSHGSHTVLDVDGYGLSKLYVLDVLDRRYKVECNLAVVDVDVFGMEVALVEAVFVYLNTLLALGLHLQVLVYDECSARLYQRCVVVEAFEISLFCAVDVEVVGVGGSNHRHPWTQPMERAVELIGFYHHIVALVRENVVGAVVF